MEKWARSEQPLRRATRVTSRMVFSLSAGGGSAAGKRSRVSDTEGASLWRVLGILGAVLF